MEDWQKRVVDERDTLAEKVAKLSQFLGTEMYKELRYAEAYLLRKQLGIMTDYHNTLCARISLFKE